MDLLLAVCKANCNRCHNEEGLFIPISDYYGLLCETCMNELKLSIDMAETKKQLGGLFPKELGEVK